MKRMFQDDFRESETGVPGKRSLLGWEAKWRDLLFPFSIPGEPYSLSLPQT